MTIYIDVVLVENIIMNFIILFATSIILREKIKYIRIILASLLGAIYVLLSYIYSIQIYTSMLLKFVLSILIVYIAFNPQNMKRMWKDILIFYLTTFVFGGVAFALIYVVRPQDILMKNGLFLGTYTLKVIMWGSIISFIIVILGFKIVKSKISKKDIFCDLEIKINGMVIVTKAMIDTGNCLREPITNTPVVVLEHTLLDNCIPKEILNNLDKIIGGDFSVVPQKIKDEYIYKFKFIPYSSLGKQNGMLLGIKPEYLKIIKEDEITKKDVIIGIYDKSLTKRGEYRALLGINMSIN